MLRIWRSARLRTVAGTVAAIGSGVMLAPLAGLGGFGGAATNPAVLEVAHHSVVRPVLHDVTELAAVKSDPRPAGVAIHQAG
jgi:hypothetical protein